MLKSTYKPSPGLAQPLLPGWSEHKAPTGHTYYYHAATKESTYTRPVVAATDPTTSYLQHQAVPQIDLSNPDAANAFMAQYAAASGPQQPHQHQQQGRWRGRGGAFESRPRPQPSDKPRSKAAIPGCEPWILVYTKYGRRFAYNPAKKASFWRIPEKLKAGILELDQARIRQKAGIDEPVEDAEAGGEKKKEKEEKGTPADPKKDEPEEKPPHDYDSSEYEEVEVTDDEEEGGDDDGHARKRQRTDEPADEDQPVEFTEADIAAQLAAMGEGYGAEGGGYDDEEDGMWPDEEDGEPALSHEDAQGLFRDLLNDFGINPYSPWEKLIEEGKVFDDPRYTVLDTMKARKETWEAWSRAKIVELRDRRAREEKKDPRIPYLHFLQERATPKLFWPEFKRKYRKEEPMRDPKLSDRDREKWYREHINRLKMAPASLKSDLRKLLESIPLALLNNTTVASALPPPVLADIRYISLDPQVRDPFVEAYIQGLAPPPEDGEQAEGEEDSEAKAAREDRRRREMALEARERAVAEEKKRQDKKLAFSRARLRDEERELNMAMQVGKKGLQSQLEAEKEP